MIWNVAEAAPRVDNHIEWREPANFYQDQYHQAIVLLDATIYNQHVLIWL